VRKRKIGNRNKMNAVIKEKDSGELREREREGGVGRRGWRNERHMGRVKKWGRKSVHKKMSVG